MEHIEVYRSHADEYDALVPAEDCDERLAAAIERIKPVGGAAILEVGLGTRRITRKLMPRDSRGVGVDRAPAMLAAPRRHLRVATASDLAGFFLARSSASVSNASAGRGCPS
jgi:ubiquinone/menaquinone biosynthesis C-methylase UbiE